MHSTPRSSHRLPPPVGLSTDAMLRLGSSILGLAPQRTMSLAEDLYTHGYLSYPRTQTTRYPDDFDIVFRLFASYETRLGVSNQFMQTNILAALAHLLNPGAPTCRAIDQTLRSSLATCSLRILPPCPQPSARTRHAKA